MRKVTRRLLLYLLPIALVALVGRDLYTPDEPREAAMVVAMVKQADKSLPTLAGAPFAEKPPLLYWLGAASASVAGDSPAALRLPGLLYILLTALSIAALVRPVAGDTGAFLAGFSSATAYILYRTETWLATDAPLVMGVAVALLGIQRMLTATSDTARRKAHAWLFAGLLASFFAKGPAGWLVPGSVLLGTIALERRWGELWRRDFLLGAALMLAPIVAWILWVAQNPAGLHSLQVLFWYNLLGRFVKIAAAPELSYANGHHNHPLDYWLSVPLYLLPWTPLVIAALARAPTALRGSDAVATTWRIALNAIALPMVFLALSATGRDVYYGPVALGFVIIIGLWFGAVRSNDDRATQLAWTVTRSVVGVLVALIGGIAIVANLAPAFRTNQSVALAALALVGMLAALVLVVGRIGNAQIVPRVALAVALCFTVLIGSLYPPLDRWLSLESFSRRVTGVTGDAALRLVEPDETTEAMAALYLPNVARETSVRDAQRALWLVPDQSQWKVRQWLGFLGYTTTTSEPTSMPPLPEALRDWVAACVLVRPGGRRVVIAERPSIDDAGKHCD